MVICNAEGHEFKAYIKVSNHQSGNFNLSLRGDIHYPRGVIAARRITCDRKEHFNRSL